MLKTLEVGSLWAGGEIVIVSEKFVMFVMKSSIAKLHLLHFNPSVVVTEGHSGTTVIALE